VLRFAFKPRHPVTRVAFTADGRELVTAQPFTGVAVRDRLTGVARVAVAMFRTSHFSQLEMHPTLGGIAVHSSTGRKLLDPVTGNERPTLVPSEDGGPAADAPEVLNGLNMWWRGSAVGQRVTLLIRPSVAPAATLGGRAVSLSSPIRHRHFIAGQFAYRFSPDGTRVALGDGETLRVFDLSILDTVPAATEKRRPTVRPFLTLERPDPTAHGTFADKQAEHWLPPVAFDHAGRTLFTLGLRNRVQRIDLATGGVIAEWGWRCEPIRSLAVAPDDLTAAAGCQRGEVVLWDLE
jgi:hypothetical protein